MGSSRAENENKQVSRMVIQYDLYIDESGTFQETRVGADGSAAYARPTGPSQLVGFFARRGSVSSESAREAITSAFLNAGLMMPPKPHAKDLHHDASYAEIIQGLIGQLKKRGWQPVRIVNEQAAVFGDRTANYTNAVAELVLDILTRKFPEVGKVVLGLHCARVVLSGDEPIIRMMQADEYRARLEEVIGRAAIRQGWAAHLSRFQIDSVSLPSGRERPELWICDFLSNASYNSFRNAGKSREELRSAFGKYDLTFQSWPWLDQIDQLAAMQYHGLAILIALDRLIDTSVSKEVTGICINRIANLVAALGSSAAATRESHLSTLSSWAEHLIADRRLLENGFRACERLLKLVYGPLIVALDNEEGETIQWFAYRLHTLVLTHHNHVGDLKKGRIEVSAIEALIPQLAGRWEHVPFLIDGLVATSVHLADCLEYEKCIQQTSLIARYYQGLSSLFVEAYPGLFPNRVKSLHCGKALGTWVQSETYLAYNDPSRATAARRISDEAIEEFASVSDKARQFQYRAHLEAVDGKLQTAREFLARSLHTESDHSALASAIQGLETFPQGFAFLHWLRIGHCSLLRGDTLEWQAFVHALTSSGLERCDWCTAQAASYPAHGILRRLAIIYAASGKREEAKGAIERLRGLYPNGTSSLNLKCVLAAALIETAILSGEFPADRPSALIYAQGKEPGARQLLDQLHLESREFPRINQLLAAWRTGLLSPSHNDHCQNEFLLSLTARFDY